MKAAHWLLPVISLGIVLVFTWRDLRGHRSAPGPLHPGHRQVPELDQGANCLACHQSGAGIDEKACMHCHVVIGQQADRKSGLHGSLPPAELARCERCHSEHHGVEVPLIAPHAFPRAGVENVAGYDHRHVQYRLVGAHLALKCEACHEGAEAAEPPKGGRFLGLSQDCMSCHEDVHRGVFGPDCESCHGQVKPFAQSPGFSHALFPLGRAHAKVACIVCHEPGSAHEIALLQEQPGTPRACAQCHENPHGSEQTPATALFLPGAGDCARCHPLTRWPDGRTTPEAHPAVGFPLRGGHARTECGVCHGDAKRTRRWSGPRPELAACGVCHEHPHAGALLTAARAAVGPDTGCAGCHADHDDTFTWGQLTAQQHAATGFSLAMPHDVACGKCHTGGGYAARFPGRSESSCHTCHEDVHRGQFTDEPRHAECTSCHAKTHFMPTDFDVAAHARTAFPLTGSHDAVACRSCHREVENGVRRFQGTAGECAICHEDVHRGKFDEAGRPKLIEGRAGCARCHDPKSFSPVIASFDHGLWTGHQLNGAHARLECTKCHAPSVGGAGVQRLGKAAGTTCAACHSEPHMGQFAAAGVTDCARCHGEVDWKEDHFDHQRQSRFPLDKQHAPLACSKCHLAYEVGARSVVRYKPLGTLCGDCHRLGKSGEVLK
ncbi:MAG TPA: cytochrome c3 family protein [Planctomycetota bacterium]